MFPLNFFKVNAKLPIAYLIYVLPKSEFDSVLKRKLKSLLHEIFNKIFAPSDPKMSTFCFMFGSVTGLAVSHLLCKSVTLHCPIKVGHACACSRMFPNI